MNIVTKLALLFFAAAVLGDPLLVQVEFTHEHYTVIIAKMKYKKKFHLETLENLNTVEIYYIQGQDTFLFSKTLGSTISNIGSQKGKIPVQHSKLSLDQKDSKMRIFRGGVDMQNVSEETKSNLQIKTISRSETLVQIYIGEMTYFSVFAVSKVLGERIFKRKAGLNLQVIYPEDLKQVQKDSKDKKEMLRFG